LASSTVDGREEIRRTFLAGYSGARFGIASDVMDVLQVSRVVPSDPVRGFNGIAISQGDAEGIKDSIGTGRIPENRMVLIPSIVGTVHGLGVEKLMGSVLPAGEPSAAYDEPFTLTYVVAWSVGIGANSVRLGQRVIQRESAASTITKTFSAPNKGIVHDVYST
jgi:acetyl-CoA carboxylase / biotin carboxylase 1